MQRFNAIVLAGDRSSQDPLVQTSGAPCKALVPVKGKAMILRVLDAVKAASCIERCTVCGPPKEFLPLEPELERLISSGEISWVETRETPCTSVSHLLEQMTEDLPLLVTTADHALLSSEIVEYFCSKAADSGCDIVAGLTPYPTIIRRFPDISRTVIKLRDGRFCSCNMFAFMTARAHEAARFWHRCEANRKKPWQQARVMGWTNVFLYMSGLLTLEHALKRLSSLMGLKAGVVKIPFPEAAIDVDKVEDLRLVEKILGKRDKS